MPIQLITLILGAVTPTLVQEAEKLFGSGSGTTKRQWVVEGVHDVLLALEKKLPAWAGTAIAAAEPLIDESIEAALDAAGL